MQIDRRAPPRCDHLSRETAARAPAPMRCSPVVVTEGYGSGELDVRRGLLAMVDHLVESDLLTGAQLGQAGAEQSGRVDESCCRDDGTVISYGSITTPRTSWIWSPLGGLP